MLREHSTAGEETLGPRPGRLDTGEQMLKQRYGARWKTFSNTIARLLAVFVFFCLGGAAFGQMNTADITGIVIDPTGAIVPRATVTALQVATQRKHVHYQRCGAILAAATSAG